MTRAPAHGVRWHRIRESFDQAASRAGSAKVSEALAGLRTRLERVHADVDAVQDDRWARYVADLDRGLAELDVELRRTAEDTSPTPTLDDLLYSHVARFELDGWALRLREARDRGHAPAPDVDHGEALVVDCARELADYRSACRVESSPSRERVEASMSAVRAAVGGSTAAGPG